MAIFQSKYKKFRLGGCTKTGKNYLLKFSEGGLNTKNLRLSKEDESDLVSSLNERKENRKKGGKDFWQITDDDVQTAKVLNGGIAIGADPEQLSDDQKDIVGEIQKECGHAVIQEAVDLLSIKGIMVPKKGKEKIEATRVLIVSELTDSGFIK